MEIKQVVGGKGIKVQAHRNVKATALIAVTGPNRGLSECHVV